MYPKSKTYSPWGRVDNINKYVRGIAFVSTPGHGGLRVSLGALTTYAKNPALIAELGAVKNYGSNYFYFEEDCAIPLFLYDCRHTEFFAHYAARIQWTPEKLEEYCLNMVQRYYASYFETAEK
jgi:hypothetical protein